MSGNEERTRTRPGWERDPELPESLEELQGPLSGSVGLPIRIFWSGADPRARRWDLADPQARRSLYEIVLAEGRLDDVRELVNAEELVRVWDQLWLSPWIRKAWAPLIASAPTAA